MKTKLMYIAKDDTAHETPEACLLHEKDLDESTIHEGIEYFVETHVHDIFADYDEVSEIVDLTTHVIKTHMDELCTILNGNFAVEDRWYEKLQQKREAANA